MMNHSTVVRRTALACLGIAAGAWPAHAALQIMEVEVTQAIQNLDNDVPLFTGRPATARVYVFTDDLKPASRIAGYLDAPVLNGAPLLSI